MKKSKGKIFVIGSAKEIIAEQENVNNTIYYKCCNNITEWILEGGYDIHLAGTVYPTADYFIINKSKELYDQNGLYKNNGKIRLYLDTASGDETMKDEASNEQLKYVKEIGIVRYNQMSEWSIVHDKIIKEVDLVIVLGGGSHSPSITDMSLMNDKIVISLSDFENGEVKKEQEVAHKFIVHYFDKVFGLRPDVLGFFKPVNIEDKQKETEFKKNIDYIVSACNMRSKKNKLYWFGYLVLFCVIAILFFWPDMLDYYKWFGYTFNGNFLIYWSAVIGAIIGAMFNYGWEKIVGNRTFDVHYMINRLLDGFIIGVGFASILAIFVNNFTVSTHDLNKALLGLNQFQDVSSKKVIDVFSELIDYSNNNIINKARYMVALVCLFMGVSKEMSKVLIGLKSVFKL